MENFDWIMGFVFPYINFILYVAIIIYLARPALNKTLANKRAAFIKQLDDANLALKEANERAAQLDEQVKSLEAQLKEFTENATRNAEQERHDTLQQAKELAQYIREEAKRVAEAEIDSAQATLKQQLVHEATKAVASRIRKEVDAGKQLQLITKDLEIIKGASAKI